MNVEQLIRIAAEATRQGIELQGVILTPTQYATLMTDTKANVVDMQPDHNGRYRVRVHGLTIGVDNI
ncbi:MAG: hypothetical protein DWQ40_00495 [Actinobacteria bacterium]|nr:MAG: hypothetical protein DWQ40_00495 [Actinomycetota bacterium]REK35596.1 MAG: hypothetical protein DWQ20_06120 [Actinomycetota bacterium]